MSSGAAQREEIQLKLQQLRERHERERAAFDAVAIANPQLTAEEVTALAQRKAEEEVPQCLVVEGVEVRVGDKVRVRDDVQLLHRADRGYFGPDVLKPIYLGERGEVVRVMASFQGKPAVELCFADGVAKVFFVECLEAEAAVAGNPAASRSRRVDPSEIPIFVPPTKPLPPPPKAETLPDWRQLSMPHRRTAGGFHNVSVPPADPPPPPPTVAAIRRSEPKQRMEKAKAAPPPVCSASPSSSPANTASAAPCSAATASAAAPPAPLHRSPPAVVMKESPVKAAKAPPPEVSSPSTAAPAIKRPSTALSTTSLTSPHTTQPPTTPALRSECGETGSSGSSPTPAVPLSEKRTAGAATAFKDAGSVQEQRSLNGASATPLRHQVPPTGVTTYQAKYELRDDASRIPRRQSASAAVSAVATGTRVCWVCGLCEADGVLTVPTRVAFPSQCTAMFSLFAVLTRKLQWDKSQRAASRLFTDKGVEIKVASAVRDGMNLVATTGCEYRSDAHPDAFRSVPDSRPLPPPSSQPPSPADPAKQSAPNASPAAPVSPPAAKRAPVMLQRKSVTASVAAATNPKHTDPAPPSPAVSKPKHIRVYENGFYDDNIYRTVTVRPTFKTLVSLKATITRELQWRDGKRVDLLFDACGAEISDLSAICDGDVVVASAGDRFVIPYPNTPMHMEAMKLSERLDPSRRC